MALRWAASATELAFVAALLLVAQQLTARCAAWSRPLVLPRFMAQNIGGFLADKQYENEDGFMQLHDQGLRRYTHEEIRAWPNKTIVYVKNDLADEWVRDVLPIVPHCVVVIFGNGDNTPPKEAVHAILTSGKGLAVMGINMPFLMHRLHHWPLAFNHMNREPGDPAVLGPWYDKVYGHGFDHLDDLFSRKQNKIFLPGLGNTHAIRDELRKWLESKENGTELVEAHAHMSNGKNFSEYLEVMSGYKFCLCPRGNGVDAHRVWECMLVGSVPIYVSNDNMPGILHAIQAEHYMTNMSRIAHTFHRVTNMHPYMHSTFLWRAHKVLTADYHQQALRLIMDNL